MAIKLSNRTILIKPSPTLTISTKAKEMTAAGIDVVNFGVGEPDFNTPDYIKQAAHKAIDANFTRYTANAGIPDLKQAICAKFKRDNDLEYEPKQILVSPGAKASIVNILTAVCDSHDQVLMPSPYWVSYPYQAMLANALQLQRQAYADLDDELARKTYLNGLKLDILESFPYPGETFAAGPASFERDGAAIGTILGLDKARGIMVQTKDGLIALRRLRLQNKKALSYKEFANGVQNLVGSVLVSPSPREPRSPEEADRP